MSQTTQIKRPAGILVPPGSRSPGSKHRRLAVYYILGFRCGKAVKLRVHLREPKNDKAPSIVAGSSAWINILVSFNDLQVRSVRC